MKIVPLFSHTFTTQQIEELSIKYSSNIMTLPSDLQRIWSQVPTAIESPRLRGYLQPIISFLNNETTKGDVVFVQGECGMTSLVVQWCFINGRTPIYATTKRKAVEVHNEDGSVTMQHKFVHAGFRKYEKL